MEIRPLTPTEQKYTYAQSMQIEGQTGTIGHLRGDFATTGYITNVGAGQGLLKVGSSLVPFVNQFPRNTELYRLMTTKFGEV